MPFLNKCLSLILLISMYCLPAMAETQANASVSNNNVFLGDTFSFTVEVNDTGSEYQLDTSVLEDNFKVSRPSRSQQTSYVNGDFKQSITWTFRLQAKQLGTLTIPPLKIGDAVTQAINIEVKKPGKEQQSSSTDNIFIENVLNKAQVYIDQPVILESKIYIAENLTEGDIQPPALTGAEVEQVAEAQRDRVVRNGLRYDVYTYQFKITPSTSGDVNITSPLLTASIRKAVRVSNLQQRMTVQTVNIRGNNLDLTVKDMPAGYQGDWLISEDVRLIENNNLQAKEYFVGDPITRSISLQVASLALEKMPEIKLNYNSSLRYYPDKDDLKQGTIEGVLYSQRTITHAIISNKSGEITLPEIKMPWWNSKTEQQEFAILPAQKIIIKPALQSNNNSNSASNNANNQFDGSDNNTQQTALTDATVNETNNALDNVNAHQQATLSHQLLLWKISTFLLLILLILLSLYHLRYSRRNNHSLKIPAKRSINEKPYQQLLKVIKAEKPNDVYSALLVYFQSQHPNLTQLQQIQDVTGLDENNKQLLLQNLHQLELACSGKTHCWSAKNLSKLMILHQKATSRNNIDALNDINP